MKNVARLIRMMVEQAHQEGTVDGAAEIPPPSTSGA